MKSLFVKLLITMGIVILTLAAPASTAPTQSIRYAGVHCDTGKSRHGEASVVCVPLDGNGFTVLMNDRWLAFRHCTAPGVCDPIIWHRNR